MKNFFFILAVFSAFLFASCERVQPNYVGVLMQNYGKDGKSDFSLQHGRVSVMAPGTELYQVPLWEQRAGFEDTLHFQDADRTEYTAVPSYSYKSIEDRAVDIVFQNKQLGSGDDFMKAVEDNILEPAIYNIAKDVCREKRTDSLTASGANLKFEKTVEGLVKAEFEKKGFTLETFTLQLIPSDKVRDAIDKRSEVNTTQSIVDQEIEKQRKMNQLIDLQAEGNRKLLTPEYLFNKLIDKWDGTSALYLGNSEIQLLKSVK